MLETVKSLPRAAYEKFAKISAELRGETWRQRARPAQLPPSGAWRTWVIVAGRGWGKTRAGAEWLLEQAERGASRIALLGETVEYAMDVMVEGPSGILALAPSWNRPTWDESRRRLLWRNGAVARVYGLDEPDCLRGPQHDAAWCDQIDEGGVAFENLRFGLRRGDARMVVTAGETDGAATPFIQSLRGPGVAVTRGTPFESARRRD